MPSSRSSTFLTVLLCLSCLVASSRGFTAPRPNCPSLSSNTRLHQSSIPDEQHHPAWFDLPSAAKTSRDRIVGVETIEDVLGRIAMVGAFSLAAGEVLTGESVTEQVVDALHSLLL